MKLFRSTKTLLILAGVLSLGVVSNGCGFAKKVIAKDKMNQGVLKYNLGQMDEAKAYFKSATEYVPDAAVAWLYYGATLTKDYKAANGDDREKLANQALDVFKKALELSKGDCKVEESAMAYITSVYDDLGKEDEWRNWMVKRAESSCASKTLKATTYHAIAVKFWQCSYDQTTRYADKDLSFKDQFHYRNMDYEAAREDKKKVEDCINHGMEYVEKALQIDPEYAEVLYYKGLLYREKQKMTKVEAERKQYESEAKSIADKATEITKRKEAEAAAKKAAEATPKS
jgi:tetratricopeptide (TPR) repeat protein